MGDFVFDMPPGDPEIRRNNHTLAPVDSFAIDGLKYFFEGLKRQTFYTPEGNRASVSSYWNPWGQYLSSQAGKKIELRELIDGFIKGLEEESYKDENKDRPCD